MDRALENAVWLRARDRCEYCLLPQKHYPLKFWIDHVVARKHGGQTVLENLALTCDRCNLHKGTDLTGIDPESHRVTGLFNPRVHRWTEHFTWNGAMIVGLTDVGRTTVRLLKMNERRRLELREALISAGLFFDQPGEESGVPAS